MKPLLLLLFLSSAFLLSCQPANSQEKASKESLATKAAPGEVISVVLSQDDFRAKMAELGAGIQLVDVRRPDEFREGHIEGALNINFLEDDFAQQMERQVNKEKPVMLYCRSGSRSASAAEELKALGFKEIYDLEGGFSDWQE